MRPMLSDQSIPISEYWRILKRRRYLLGLPAAGIFILTIFYVLSIPATYRSEATILIEDQEIPEDIVGATITNYVSQEIELITQRLFTLKTINEVVEKFDIYSLKDSEKNVPPAIIAKKFRDDMEIEVVSAETLSPRGQEVQIAVAVMLAFNSADRKMAQQVAQELVDLFLSENQRSSTSRTTGVSQLLRSAVEKANEELLVAEAELAAFKVDNQGALPELHELNVNVINRTEQQLSDVTLRLGELQRRKLQLSAQLSALSPSAPVTLPSGETVMSDRDRLRALIIDYRRKSAIYQTGHPDLVRLKREIESLQKTVGDTGTYAVLQEQLRQERDRLNGLRERYSDDHPDILNAQAAIQELEAQLAKANFDTITEEEVADNPAYVLVNTQLQSTNLEIDSLLQKRQELQSILGEHEGLIKRAPIVEMQYDALLRKYENAKTKHDDLAAKLRAADVAADVEIGITGQRFELIEPPALPLEPEERNVVAILILGLLSAIGIGVACTFVAESLDKSIRSAKQLAEIAGAPPLAVIPYINNSSDIALARARQLLMIFGFMAVCVVGVAYYFIQSGIVADFLGFLSMIVNFFN